jgi:ribosomal protein S27AE
MCGAAWHSPGGLGAWAFSLWEVVLEGAKCEHDFCPRDSCCALGPVLAHHLWGGSTHQFQPPCPGPQGLLMTQVSLAAWHCLLFLPHTF